MTLPTTPLHATILRTADLHLIRTRPDEPTPLLCHRRTLRDGTHYYLTERRLTMHLHRPPTPESMTEPTALEAMAARATAGGVPVTRYEAVWISRDRRRGEWLLRAATSVRLELWP